MHGSLYQVERLMMFLHAAYEEYSLTR